MYSETNTPSNQPRPDKQPATLEAPHLRLAHSTSYIRNVTERYTLSSDKYIAFRAAGKSDAEAFAPAARAVTESGQDLDGFDRSVIHLTGMLGAYLDAELTADRIRSPGKYSHQSDRHDYAYADRLVDTRIMPFNHAIKELINENPELDINNLATNLTEAYMVLYSHTNNLNPREPRKQEHHVKYDTALDHLHHVIDGMRHELAAETLLDAAGIEYEYDTSVREDRKGHDMFVIIDGFRIGIDIKASYTAEERAHAHHPRSVAVWTGLYPEDFLGIRGRSPGAVSIPFAIAQKKCGQFVERIRNAAKGKMHHGPHDPHQGGSQVLRASRF